MTLDWYVPAPSVDAYRGCWYCKHFNWRPAEDEPECPAWPEGVPWPIVTGQTDHMVERLGQVPGFIFTDNGWTFEEVVALAGAAWPPGELVECPGGGEMFVDSTTPEPPELEARRAEFRRLVANGWRPTLARSRVALEESV